MNKQEVIEILEKKRETALDNSEYYRDKENEKYEKMNRARVDSYMLAIQLVEQLDEPQAEKVEVPDFVAEWFESRYHINQDIYNLLFKGNMLNDNSLTKFEKWFYSNPINNFETLIRMKDGYTVKPKRWVVRAGDYHSTYVDSLTITSEKSHHTISGKEKAHYFTDRAKAEAVATLVEGSVEEV